MGGVSIYGHIHNLFGPSSEITFDIYGFQTSFYKLSLVKKNINIYLTLMSDQNTTLVFASKETQATYLNLNLQ